MPVNTYDPNALSYAQDALYDAAGDEYDGTSTNVVPSLGVAEQGARPKRQLPAQHRNWFDNQVAWMLRALHEPLADLTALAAIDVDTTPPVRAVRDYGLYEWVLGDLQAEDQPRIVADAGNTGRWHLFNFRNIVSAAFTSDDSLSVPDGCDMMIAALIGAGGGGGAGGQPIVNTGTSYALGGGGGGAGQFLVAAFPTTPGATITITVGTKGLGGTSAAGGNGEDTVLAIGATELARARGGGGGRVGVGADTADAPSTVYGGRPPGGVLAWPSFAGALEVSNTDPFRVAPCEGGPGGGRLTAGAGTGGVGGRQPLHNHSFGSPDSDNYAGGSGGATGGDAGGFLGGNGGGGGASGVFGAGADGGDGGAGHATTGVAGQNGDDAAVANSGAGGGGGGGGGGGSASVGTDGQGGDGADGLVVIIFIAHELG